MTISLPFTNNTLSLPASVACVLFTVFAVMLAQAGLWLFNKWRIHEKLEKSNEVGGIVFGAIGLLYSLILAFVIVAVWDDYSDLEKTIEAETDKLNGILSQSSTLPDGQKEFIAKSIYDYCDQVIKQEWHMQEMKSDHPSAIPGLRHALLITVPDDKIQKRVYDALDKDLSAVTDLRRARLSHTHSQMPLLIWRILQGGTVLLVLFAYFFYVSSVRLKRVYVGFLVISVSMCMFLVYTLDHPFDGKDGVSNETYGNVQEELNAYLPIDSENAEAERQAAFNSFNYNHSKIP